MCVVDTTYSTGLWLTGSPSLHNKNRSCACTSPLRSRKPEVCHRASQSYSHPTTPATEIKAQAQGCKSFWTPALLSTLSRLGLNVSTTTISSVDDFEGEIGRSFELMRRIAAAVRAAGKMSSLPIVLAGNCFSSIGVCAGLDDTDRGYLGMIWHDAHDDCHTPDTLEGGYFDAMGDPMLTGVSWRALVDSIPGFHALNRDNVIFCGVRDVTAIERQRLIDAGFKIVWGPSLTMRHTSTLLQS